LSPSQGPANRRRNAWPVGDRLGHPYHGTPLGIGTPVLGQEETQADADRHLGPGQGERDQRLAVGPLAELAAVLPLHADRVAALLRQGGVVHDQHRVRPAHQPVGGLDQLVLQRCRGPGGGRDEVVQLLGVARRDACRHRLDALALAGRDQPLEVDRRPAALRLALQPFQEGRQPALELTLPVVRRRPLHRAPPPRASSRQERPTRQKVAG
jgi:hypothetical protein